MKTIMGTRREVLAGMGAGAALLASGAGTVALAQDTTQAAQGKVLKIGVLGVMRGPAASWGLVNRYSAETTAETTTSRAASRSAASGIVSRSSASTTSSIPSAPST